MVAGELSGDLLGAGLISELKQYYPDLQVYGVGGPRMLAAGATSQFPLERLSVMGIFEVLKDLRGLLALRRGLVASLLQDPPDVFIGIDAPDFNLPIAKQLRQHGIPTVHYVSPSVWAWRQGRVKSIAESVRLMLTLLPFEADFYRDQRVKACFVGHPLADEIAIQPQPAGPLRTQLGLQVDKTTIALLPGSRMGEIKRLAPPMLEAAELCSAKYPQLQFVVGLANANAQQLFDKLVAQRTGLPPLQVVVGNTRMVMGAADFLLATSGTVTLEGLLLKKPMLVAYKITPLTYWLVKTLRMMKIDKFSLPNLLSDIPLVEEYIQSAASGPNLARGLLGLIDQPQRCQQMLENFHRIHQQLRCDANVRAARAVHQLLEEGQD